MKMDRPDSDLVPRLAALWPRHFRDFSSCFPQWQRGHTVRATTWVSRKSEFSYVRLVPARGLDQSKRSGASSRCLTEPFWGRDRKVHEEGPGFRDTPVTQRSWQKGAGRQHGVGRLLGKRRAGPTGRGRAGQLWPAGGRDRSPVSAGVHARVCAGVHACVCACPCALRREGAVAAGLAGGLVLASALHWCSLHRRSTLSSPSPSCAFSSTAGFIADLRGP